MRPLSQKWNGERAILAVPAHWPWGTPVAAFDGIFERRFEEFSRLVRSARRRVRPLIRTGLRITVTDGSQCKSRGRVAQLGHVQAAHLEMSRFDQRKGRVTQPFPTPEGGSAN